MRAARALVRLAVLVGIAALTFWAGAEIAGRPEAILEDDSPQLYIVSDGQVGRTQPVVLEASWTLTPVANLLASGVATSIDVVDGQMLEPGDVLATVDLVPIVAAEGAVPMFRDLRRRDEGPDVAQMQELLSQLGHYGGEIDGVFGRELETAVRSWEESIGAPEDGVVELTQVVFFPELDSPIVLPDLAVGDHLSGQPIPISAVSGPDFFAVLSLDQLGAFLPGRSVEVLDGDRRWAGEVGRTQRPADGGLARIPVLGEEGGPLCGQDCQSSVALREVTTFSGSVEVQPLVEGPLVPLAAIRTEAAGDTYVLSSSGNQIQVTVLASDLGLAIVDGVSAGTTIVLRDNAES